MIQSFRDDQTRMLLKREFVRRVPEALQNQAHRRLLYLNAATRIEDLYIPPSNGFHKVGKGFALKVNAQWRITFKWGANGPEDVLFEDYH
jgi:toxin HigB-1